MHEPSLALQKRPFLAFLGMQARGGKLHLESLAPGRCRQPNAARLHPVSLVGPETRTKRTLGSC
jgi:hypothetical protein